MKIVYMKITFVSFFKNIEVKREVTMGVKREVKRVPPCVALRLACPVPLASRSVATFSSLLKAAIRGCRRRGSLKK